MSIVVESLSKVFGKQKALNNIHFEVQTGEIVGFLGPNGAGKSTTMKIATGYLQPTSGTIKISNIDVLIHSKEVRRKLGYLPEHNPLYLDMYVKEYLQWVGKLRGLRGEALDLRMKEMIGLCGLEKEQYKKISALSKGYRQRVGLAQALLHNPPVLILDEPTSGLDPNQLVEIRNLIREIGKEKTVLFSTHIMQEVQALCQRTIIINQGNIVANETVENLKNLGQKSTIFLSFDNEIDPTQINSIPGVESIKKVSEKSYEVYANVEDDLRAEISKLAFQNGWLLLEIKKQENSLEKIFQQLTQ